MSSSSPSSASASSASSASSTSVRIKQEPVSPTAATANPSEKGDGKPTAKANGTTTKVTPTEVVSIKKEPVSPASTPEKKKSNGGAGGPKSADYDKLVGYGLDEKVAARLDEIYQTGKLSHSDLDDRALDALKEFPSDGAMAVLAQFLESNLEHVSNKSAYLCGVMKTYRQKTRAAHQGSGHLHNGASSVNGGASSSSTSTSGASASAGAGASASATSVKGPDKDKIKEILERTGYTLDVTTGQRKYGGPPPDWDGPPPGYGCEVFCGKIPRDLYEDELIPLFERCGKIWDLRLMMDPMTSLNRGYAFVTFTTRSAAQEAVKQLNLYEIAEGKALKVNVSHPKTRLFIGNIPKSKSESDIESEFSSLSGKP